VSLRIVTLKGRRARFESEDKTLEYDVLTGLSVEGSAKELTFTGWRITRNIIDGAQPSRHTVQLEASLANRLRGFAEMCWAGGRSGFGSFSLIDIVLNRSFVVRQGVSAEGSRVDIAQVTPGMPCVITTADRRPNYGFMGLGSGLGLTYGPRSLGPAVVRIAELQSFMGGAAVYTVR
jgi:hypothetical protein